MNAALEYYQRSNDVIPALVGLNGSVEHVKISLPHKNVEYGDIFSEKSAAILGENIEKLYTSVAPRTVTVDGSNYTFEIGHIMGDSSEETELRAATYRSTLTNNFGNGFEVARLAMYNPQRTYIYLGALGNGLSSSLPSSERRYMQKYGRLLVDDEGIAKPLPVVKALGKVLFDEGFDINRLGSDSAGALMTVAYGAVFGDGKISSVHQNVRPNVIDKGAFEIAKDMLVIEQRRSVEHSKVSPDVYRMRPAVLEFTKKHAGESYRKQQFKGHTALTMLWANAVGLGKGPAHGDPLIADNVALRRTNPNANILFTVGSEDPLSEDPGLNNRMRDITFALSGSQEARTTSIIVEGSSHSLQTHYPQFLQTLVRTVLG